MMSVESEMQARLAAAFSPSELVIENQSHRHAGHAGDDGSGESHFAVRIRSVALAPLGRVARHRAVHQALGDLVGRIHALAIDAG